MSNFERLNMHIDWSALTEKEQIELHRLLTKAHSAYENNIKNTKYRIYYKITSNGITKPTNYVFDSAFDANQKCAWLNEESAAGVFGKYFYKEDEE